MSPGSSAIASLGWSPVLPSRMKNADAAHLQRLVDLGAGPQDLALTPRMHTEGAEPLSATKVLSPEIVAGLVAMGHQVNRVDSLAGGIGCAELRKREGGKAPRRRQCGGGGNLLRLPPRSSESSYRIREAQSPLRRREQHLRGAVGRNARPSPTATRRGRRG